MAPSLELLSMENPLFRTYAFYVAVLTLKVLFMAPLTVIQRKKHDAFPAPEDLKYGSKDAKVVQNENVERVRNAHRNDLENIPVFMFISLLYIMTDPNVFLATMLIRIYAVCRIAHSYIYTIMKIHHPRGMVWGISYLITVYMGVSLILSFSEAM